MKLLNLCCGAVRPQGEEWINVDNLHATLLPGTPERENLDKEKNYHNRDIVRNGVPVDLGCFDGILISHALEHFDCQAGVTIMDQCHFTLKPGGVLLVSVPDASYFRKVHAEDTVENAMRLFGEPIHLPDGETTFFGYGLWNRWHKAVLTEDALWCYFRRAGFSDIMRLLDGYLQNVQESETIIGAMESMVKYLNRLPFSLVMCGVKE